MMAISVEITKDIQEYEPKVVGPLTMRQLIVVTCATPFMYWAYTYARPVLGKDLGSMAIFFPAAIAWLIGWPRPYGMKVESFVKTAFISHVIAPSIRKYKTENYFDRLQKEAIKIEQKEEMKKKNSQKGKKQKTKNKKKKYKKSKLAIK